MSSPAEFSRAAAALQAGTGPFAIDTERASSYRYDDRAFLVQIRRQGAGTYLLAPEHHRRELGAALAPVLGGQEWVMHAAPSDLPCLGWLGLYPGSVFDTELAARFAGFDHPNLAAVILELFDVELEKGYGDADWSEVPLPHQWRNYAALDVELLNEAAEALRDILAEEEKLEWFYQECAAIQERFADVSEPAPRSWREHKGIGSLRSPRQRAVARALWQRREEIARAQDVAPGRILPNRTLTEIARTLPDSHYALNKVTGFPRRRAGATVLWMDVVEQGMNATPPAMERTRNPVPSKSVWTREHPELWADYQDLRADFEDLAEELHMGPDLVIKPALLRATVWAWGGESGELAGTVRSAADVSPFLRSQGARPWQCDVGAPIIIAGLGLR
ncbi:HRDC domain-containing protein [Corynebacterium sp.]|uniref:HRDC domain-containing protein n=1 Tax=Corynebacterium sp. TaxID=1720 RepID=UPI0026DD764A|nr:HRDC domain-containing protein [Corynebacterium sp.]